MTADAGLAARRVPLLFRLLHVGVTLAAAGLPYAVDFVHPFRATRALFLGALAAALGLQALSHLALRRLAGGRTLAAPALAALPLLAVFAVSPQLRAAAYAGLVTLLAISCRPLWRLQRALFSPPLEDRKESE